MKRLPLYRRLSEADRTELQHHVQVFIAEKKFEGCGGLKMRDEIKVVVATHACLLLLHRETDYFPRVCSVLVYPTSFMSPVTEHTEDGLVAEGWEARDGEAWEDGVVILAWEEVRHDAAHPEMGRNVVLHEFAHQLDAEDGVTDGAPALRERGQYKSWARTFGETYAQLRRDAERHRSTLLDDYGATDPAEFFAVATECYFTRPQDLREQYPKLYKVLKSFYQFAFSEENHNLTSERERD